LLDGSPSVNPSSFSLVLQAARTGVHRTTWVAAQETSRRFWDLQPTGWYSTYARKNMSWPRSSRKKYFLL